MRSSYNYYSNSERIVSVGLRFDAVSVVHLLLSICNGVENSLRAQHEVKQVWRFKLIADQCDQF